MLTPKFMVWVGKSSPETIPVYRPTSHSTSGWLEVEEHGKDVHQYLAPRNWLNDGRSVHCPTMSNHVQPMSNLSLWLKARSIPGDLVRYSRQCVFFWDSMGRSSDSEARIISGKHMLCGRQCLLQDLRYKHSYTWMSVLFAKIVCIHWYVHIMHLRYVYIYIYVFWNAFTMYLLYTHVYIYIYLYTCCI